MHEIEALAAACQAWLGSVLWRTSLVVLECREALFVLLLTDSRERSIPHSNNARLPTSQRTVQESAAYS